MVVFHARPMGPFGGRLEEYRLLKGKFMRNWGEFSVFAENDDYRLAPTKGRRQRVKAQANEMEARGLIRRASNWSGRLQEGKLGEMKRPR